MCGHDLRDGCELPQLHWILGAAHAKLREFALRFGRALHVLSSPCWPLSLQITQDPHMRFSCCLQVAEKSRWALPGGPSLRSQSARWLWFATATLDLGAPHANQLLREFALCSGQGPARAAQSLLALLPAELHDALEQVRLALI